MTTRVRFQAPHPEPTLAERLVAACEMADFGRELVAIRYRHLHPGATDDEVKRAVQAWLDEDPPAGIVSNRLDHLK